MISSGARPALNRGVRPPLAPTLMAKAMQGNQRQQPRPMAPLGRQEMEGDSHSKKETSASATRRKSVSVPKPLGDVKAGPRRDVPMVCIPEHPLAKVEGVVLI